MSRGPGKWQQYALTKLEKAFTESFTSTGSKEIWLDELIPEDASPSQIESIRRAVRTLAEQGKIKTETVPSRVRITGVSNE